MPFIPHTEDEIREMLSTCGVESLEALFDEIPDNLRVHELEGVPEAVGEQEISRIMHRRAEADGMPMSFLGAGAYEHHIPAAVWEITTRGEYYSAYTPYQAEASQGTLQLIYEYQTMMASLTGMEVSNASLYDGASALAEACLMAVRANRKSKARRILMPATVHPLYRQVAEAICGSQDIVFDTLPYDRATGRMNPDELERFADEDVTAVVIPQPNFFGVLEQADEIADWAHARKALVIGVVNPTTLGVLQPPGQWGETGADIVCGEGQPLGVPLSSGGPYFGLMCCKQKYVRQMPGRLSGKTVDLDGREGYTLTLQPREQHIRRSKATSNICTNQGLMVTAATIYMSLVGPDGLERIAATSHQRTRELVERLEAVEGVERVFSEPFFHEAVLRLDRPVEPVLEALADRGILGGLDLSRWYPELENCLLVCATETKLAEDIDAYAEALTAVMRETRVA